MTKLSIVYDPKAEKQFKELDTATQEQIKIDLDEYIDDVLKYKGKWIDFWAVQSKPYRVLIRAEHDKSEVLVLDISRKRFA